MMGNTFSLISVKYTRFQMVNIFIPYLDLLESGSLDGLK